MEHFILVENCPKMRDTCHCRSPEKTARTISDQTGDITASIADDLSKIYQANEMDLDGLVCITV